MVVDASVWVSSFIPGEIYHEVERTLVRAVRGGWSAPESAWDFF